MDPLYVKLVIMGLAVIAIALSVYYGIDGFDSDPLSGTRGCDSSCSNGYSKTSGKPCCRVEETPTYPLSQSDCPRKTTFIKGSRASDNYCGVCVTLDNGKTECHTAGNYDTTNFKSGSIDSTYSDSDVLDTKARGSYLDDLRQIRREERRKDRGNDVILDDKDLLEEDTSYDSRRSRGSYGSRYSDNSLTKDAAGTRDGSKGGSWSNSNRWTNGKSGSLGSKLDTDSSKNHTKSPPDDDSISNILNNRIKSCKKLLDRSFERPSEENYDKGARRGHDSCNKFKSLNNEEEEDVCEGFSPLL